MAYQLEKMASKQYAIQEPNVKINILCYNICTDLIEPFLLFMLKHDKQLNEMIFPFVMSDDTDEDIEDKICDLLTLQNIVYYGILCDNLDNYFAIVKIIDIPKIKTENIYFSPTTEIINNKKIYDIPIQHNITKIFINTPIIGMLLDKKTKYFYNLPDVVYKHADKNNENSLLIFGNEKEKIFESCDEYYFFNRKYIYNNLNCIRFAMFVGNKVHFENNDELILTDAEINHLLKNDKYKTIIISYTNFTNQNPDILSLDYNNFIPISFHL